MKIKFILLSFFFGLLCLSMARAQQDKPIKIKMEINADDYGNAKCVMENKYTAEAWDVFMKTIGNNTSILKNNMIRIFPKYELADFEYKQDADDRTNTIQFNILGLMEMDQNGNWIAKLDKKDPDITKVSDNSFLLMEDGNSLKINLPKDASGAKITKDSFGMAAISFPADEGGSKSLLFLAGGILVMAFGGFMLRKNMRTATIKTMYEPAPRQREQLSTASVQIAEEVKPVQVNTAPGQSGTQNSNQDHGKY